MAEQFSGKATFSNNSSSSQKVRMTVDPGRGNLALGGNGQDGDLSLFPSRASYSDTDWSEASAWINGEEGNLMLGGKDTDGDIALFPKGTTISQRSFDEATIMMSAETQGFRGPGGGMIELRDAQKRPHIRIFGSSGDIRVGGNGAGGDLLIYPNSGDISNRNSASIHIDGDRGDIILRNADCAEDFDIVGEGVEPGVVMVIDDDGRLRLSCDAYDRRVAGVISGAGDYRPGLVLDKQPRPGRHPIALMGKVFCKVDATPAAITVGDLLTTSSVPGHAMKAADPQQAFGAVIGKALRPLATGVGLIPILIALQ